MNRSESRGTYGHSSSTSHRSSSVPRYNGNNNPEEEAENERWSRKSSNDFSFRRSRDRSHSIGASVRSGGYQQHGDNRSEPLSNYEHRFQYINSILDRYYSHPSNRYHSMPSALRKQVFDIAAAKKSLAMDDTTSEVSSHVSGQFNRAVPDPYAVDEDDRASTLTGGRNGGKKKSRFFRSSSIRSLKKWMNKLRGKSRKNGYTTTDNLFGSAPSQDSGLETPSDTSVNYNAVNRGASEHRDSPNYRSSTEAIRHQQKLSYGNVAENNIAINDIPTPALCGIVNHGNTCYINAVVQCLSNTDLLAEYFLSGKYSIDLRNNIRNADRYGSQGDVTVALARFLKALWFNNYTADVSAAFKTVVERYSQQYRGNQQQDAQEFFYWLADRVHEDLNVAVKRRYKLQKSRSKNEDELATAAMEKYLEAHNSFISARFHGLLLSTVTCPVCYKQSMKPDPFMGISLPVPQSTKRPLFVIVVFLNRQPRQVCFGLNADVTATFYEVKKCLAEATGLPIDQMILCELNEKGFQTTLTDQKDMTTLGQGKYIWALEVPSVSELSRDEELVLLISNQFATANGNGQRFGSPVTLKVHREVSYGDLCRSVLLALRPQLRNNTLVQDIPLSVFRMRVVDDYRPLVYVPTDVALPLYTQAVDNGLLRLSESSALHLKLMVEWQRDAKDRFFRSSEEPIVDHLSAKDLRDQEANPEIQSVHECLSEYTQPESCQWSCSDCGRLQDRAVKRIVLYWLPDVLVFHLKRFKQVSSGQLVKLESTVWFPVNDLDLSDFTHQSLSNSRRKAPPSNGYRTPNGELYVDTRTSQNIYDLYAVCNHHGDSLHSGHYTAFCRNPVNGRWYCFDDQSVTPIRERDLVTSAAYLLFYERRQFRKGSDGHNSAESGFVDHWYFRLYADKVMQQERRQSCSSKDTLDGIDSNGSSNGSQRKTSVDRNQNAVAQAAAAAADSLSARRFSQNQLFVQLPEAKTSELKQSLEARKEKESETTLTNGTSKPEKEPADPPIAQLIPIDLPSSYVKTLTAQFDSSKLKGGQPKIPTSMSDPVSLQLGATDLYENSERPKRCTDANAKKDKSHSGLSSSTDRQGCGSSSAVNRIKTCSAVETDL